MFSHKLHVIALLLLSLILLEGMPYIAESEGQDGMTTIMIYMCGSDLESLSFSATKDIEEILHSGVNPDQCNILLMVGGSKTWGNQYISEKGPGIYQVIKQVNDASQLRLRKLTFDVGNNMGEASTLQAFLSYCHNNYAADNHVLIFWDHGGGPMEGVCYDETQKMDSLSLSEIKEALKGSGFSEKSISLIGFDSCLMASLETASVCAPYAEYMIASQETEPADGWNYSFLRDISSDTSGKDIAELIMEKYIDPDEENLMLTLSCIDLGKVNMILEAMNEFFSEVGNHLTIRTFTQISNDRKISKSFGRATTMSDYDLVDLYHLTQQFEEIAGESARNVQTAIRDAVYSVGNQENANGLSIYSPYYNKYQFNSKWQKEYEIMNYSSAYYDYMERFANIWQGKQLGDWSKLIYQAQPVNKQNDSQMIELELSEDQLEYYSSAKIEILQYTGINDSYRKVYEADIGAPEGQILRYDYDFSMLYAMETFSGKTITDPISFETIDGYIVLTPELRSRSNANLTLDLLHSYESDLNFEPGVYAPTILRCRQNEKGNVQIESFSILNYDQFQMAPEERLLFARESDQINTDVFHYLNFNENVMIRNLTRDTDGISMPYDTWELSELNISSDSYFDTDGTEVDALSISSNMEVHEFGEIDLQSAWYLGFRKTDEQDRLGLYAQFIIIDSQGNEIASELIPLNQENIKKIENLDEVIFEDEEHHLNLTLQAAEFIKTDYDSELHLSVRETGLLDSNVKTISLITSIEINGKKLSYTHGSSSNYDNSRNRIRLQDIVISGNTFLRSIEEINNIRIQGQINYHEDSWENPLEYKILGSFDQEITLNADMDGFSINDQWKAFGETTLYNIVYQIRDLTFTETSRIEGILYMQNQHGRQRTVTLKKDEENSPGVIINDLYIPNAWEGPDKIALDPHEEVYIDFAIHIPDGYNNMIAQLGSGHIETFSLILEGSGTSYGYMENGVYRVIFPGYEKMTIALKNAPVIKKDHYYSIKPILLGNKVAAYISGMRLENGIVTLDLLLKNDNQYLYALDLFQRRISQPYTDIEIQSVSIDGEEMKIRANSDYTNSEKSGWNSHCTLKNIYPGIYEHGTLQIARRDGSDIQNEFSSIRLQLLSKLWDSIEYDSTSAGEITVVTPKPEKAEWNADEIKISPSVAFLDSIHFVLPEDSEQYNAILNMELPQEVISRYDKGEVEQPKFPVVLL